MYVAPAAATEEKVGTKLRESREQAACWLGSGSGLVIVLGVGLGPAC